jgi:hypothetical protein
MARTTLNSKRRETQREEKESQMEIEEPQTQVEMQIVNNSPAGLKKLKQDSMKRLLESEALNNSSDSDSTEDEASTSVTEEAQVCRNVSSFWYSINTQSSIRS